MRKLILSTCGTSLLTNCLNTFGDQADRLRSLLTKHANTTDPNTIPPDEREELQHILDQALEQLLQADTEKSKKLSAELSGLFILDQGKLDNQNSLHWLIASDTWLGKETAGLIQIKIEEQGAQAEVKVISQLRTNNIDDFNQGASELARLCHEEIKGMRDGGYRVIFNLTGGFKGVQGYMQALGTIYADECVYTFERTGQLIRLPRLPFTLNTEDIIRKHLRAFRRMNVGLKTTADDIQDMPSEFIFESDGEYTLSTWGQVIWNEGHEGIYEGEIHLSFDSKLNFAASFLHSTDNTSALEKRRINQRIDDLIQYLYNEKKNPKSLDFKPLRGKHNPWTHECDAWQDGKAKRLFGHFEGSSYILDELAMPLH